MKNIYPTLEAEDVRSISKVVREIIRLRESEDLPDYDNQVNIFVTGRTVTRIPSGPTDVLASDNNGDIAYDGTYQYTLVDVSGTLMWDRRALNTSW